MIHIPPPTALITRHSGTAIQASLMPTDIGVRDYLIAHDYPFDLSPDGAKDLLYFPKEGEGFPWIDYPKGLRQFSSEDEALESLLFYYPIRYHFHQKKDRNWYMRTIKAKQTALWEEL